MQEFCNAAGPDESKCSSTPHDDTVPHEGKNRLGTKTYVWSGKKVDRHRTTWRCA